MKFARTWLPGLFPITAARLSVDVMAGVTLAALGIPEVMGYSKIIGTPVITGLYTLVLPILAFALLGSSRHLVVAADSATAAIVAAGAVGLAASGSPEYVALTGLVALMAGLLLLLARVLRLGFLANFLSRTVLVGFLTGVGVQVALGQVHGILGMDKPGGNLIMGLLQTVHAMPALHWPSLWIALVVLVISLGLKRFSPRFPGALVAVIGLIVANFYFDYASLGVKLVGEVPAGLPHLLWPEFTLQKVVELSGIAFSCFVVILAQSAATSRAYAFQFSEYFNEDRDLLGLAAANLMAAVSGTFVVNGSPTKTEMVVSSGGRSQWSHITAAGVVLLVLLFLTKPLSVLPNPALAAIVFLIGINLIDLRGLRAIYHYDRAEFWLALLTAVTVVAIGVEQGILLALVLSLLNHVRRSYRPSTAILLPDTYGHWLAQTVRKASQPEPGLVVYWFGADLFYANVEHFRHEVEHLAAGAKPALKWLVIDAGAMTGIDYSAGETLAAVQQYLLERSIRLVWVHFSVDLSNDLQRAGILQPGNHFATLRECLIAFAAVRK
jgi:SulP family sulfate permease